METEERQELPWNAWIAAKKQEGLAPMPEENQLKPPQSPGQARRRSFVQWLTDKDIDALRKQHASSQIDEQEEAGATGKKGKSFEEWLEDKHMESKREKEREREKDEAMRSEAENKMRRRRMSQQKYQSWLQAKELKALEAEEKLLGEAQYKLEKMKVKWEEEDEMKKGVSKGGKVNVGRTNSCPATQNSNKISRQRFHSLQTK